MRTAIAALTLTLGLALQAAAPLGRPAPELKVVEPSGKQTLLSAQKGKVVLVQFLFTWCSHCQDTAKVLSKLQGELGPQGFQVLGLAFNDEVQTKDAARNNAEVTKFKAFANFPVGITPRDTVMKTMGFSVMDKIGVPLILVVDRKGMVRAQSLPTGSSELQQEASLRTLLTKPLSEKP